MTVVYMIGRRLEVGSGSPMKFNDGLDVWIRRLYARARDVRGNMLIVVA